jgi:hypothetical protein
MLDRCAKEPEFIVAIIHGAPERPNEFVFYELSGSRLKFVQNAASQRLKDDTSLVELASCKEIAAENLPAIWSAIVSQEED